MTKSPTPFYRDPANLARFVLVLTTVLWSLSFPVPRGAQLFQRHELRYAIPPASDFLLVSTANFVRFSLAFVMLFLWQFTRIGKVTRAEWIHGLGLGIMVALALDLQTWALLHTESSIVAFLSQLYSLFVPLIVAIIERKLPSWRVTLSCLLVAAGVALLSPGLLTHLKMETGELLTVVSAVLIAGQILWVNRRAFRKNRTTIVTLVMFGFMTAYFLITALLFGEGTIPLRTMYDGYPIQLVTLFISLVLTVFPFLLMNHWQPKLEAVEAGIIYCSEPVMVAILVTFVPGWLSYMLGVDYKNELLSGWIWVGGTLIVLATFLVVFDTPKGATAVKTEA